jgi:hypothetical protein
LEHLTVSELLQTTFELPDPRQTGEDNLSPGQDRDATTSTLGDILPASDPGVSDLRHAGM